MLGGRFYIGDDMKKGANFKDQNDIARWAEAGKSAEEISEIMSIELSCVESFMPDKPKRKRRTKAEIEADEAAAAEAEDNSDG